MYRDTSFSNLILVHPDKISEVIEDLRQAVVRVDRTLEEFRCIRLDGMLAQNIANYRSKLNKYALLGSDCSWREYDEELASAISNIDMCYGILMNTQNFYIGNLVYVCQMLEMVRDTFENKIEEYREYLL
ncbi:MAG: hypothetical protein IJ215_00230 [Clostridia bacterium]|nr:hypothetical protein [Clostridia bacterium]